MKNQISSQPRFICRLVRLRLEVERVDPNALAASARGHGSTEPNNALGSTEPKATSDTRSTHVATCADCQRYFAACADLESSLRRGAARQREAAPEGLEQRIIRAVNLSKPPAQSSLLRPSLLAFTGIAAAAALTIVQYNKLPHPAGIYVPEAGFSPTAPGATAEVATAETPWASALPAARELLQQDPLNDEVKSVYHDAKSAVNFLERNFLPNGPESTLGSDQQPATS